jgi:hypothetical protein
MTNKDFFSASQQKHQRTVNSDSKDLFKISISHETLSLCRQYYLALYV